MSPSLMLDIERRQKRSTNMTVKIPSHVKKNLKELKNYYIECAPELEQTAEECLSGVGQRKIEL